MNRGDQQPGPYVKKVQLPSGKTIEVVYFEDMDEATTADSLQDLERQDVDTPRTETDLHVCRACDSELVYPTAWEEDSRESWRVTLRCPECETTRRGVFDQDSVEAFDDVLDAGTDELSADYRKLMRANMAEEVDRFAAALAADAILPEDF